MDLDQVRATIRPRGPWEGVDLGFALAREWFLPLWALWWLTALPLAALSGVWLRERPDLWLLLLWWFKPLFEALPLLWLARALFGTPPALGPGPRHWAATVRALVSSMQIAGLLPYLLWRRLAPARSLDLPVSLLEGLRGRAQRARRQVVRGGEGTGGWLTLICLHLEMILGLGAVLALFFLVPEELPRLDLEAALFDPGSWAYWIACLVSLAAMSVMAPFYLAGGFALYLSRRIRLEAWDLELVFRRAAERRRATSDGSVRLRGRGAALPVLGLALALAALPVPGPVQAAQSPDLEEAKALIREVLAEADFGSKRDVQGWVYVGDGSDPDAEKDPETADLPWLRALADWIALAAEPLRWTLALAAAVLVALLLRRILRDLPGVSRHGRPVRRRPGSGPRSLGADAAPLPLPEDIPGAVRARLAVGDARAALALLYRAGLARLRGLGLSIPAGATEGECLRLAARTRPAAELAYLRRLTRLWQGLAYAHRPPPQVALDDLLAHWHDWGAGPAGHENGSGSHAP